MLGILTMHVQIELSKGKRHWMVCLLCLWVVIGLLSCRGWECPSAPAMAGELSGHVRLLNVGGNPLVDHSGVTVRIAGSQWEAESDSSGKWTIADVEMGTHTIEFHKKGFGNNVLSSVSFVGGGTDYVGQVSLGMIPANAILTLAVDSVSSWDITMTAKFDAVAEWPSESGVIFYIGLDSLVAREGQRYLGVDIGAVGRILPDSTALLSMNRRTCARVASVGSGAREVYVVAHAASLGFSASSYTDTASGLPVFTAVNSHPSNVVRVAVP